LRSEPGRLVKFPTALQRKVGRVGPISPVLVARAEAALDRLSVNFGPWLAEEILHLAAVRASVRATGFNAETAANLNIRVHELKSLAATYGFPLITQIAESLCRLIEDEDTRLAAPLLLIDAHIDAISAAMRDDVRTDNDPIGRALVDALDERVRAIG
jgi:hypothetical protein